MGNKVIMIRKYSPSFKFPAKVARDREKTALQNLQTWLLKSGGAPPHSKTWPFLAADTRHFAFWGVLRWFPPSPKAMQGRVALQKDVVRNFLFIRVIRVLRGLKMKLARKC
jgi:hypothetical protein